ncbi:MAG: tetratricopeptide repeat protein [Coleofasciculus sp. D1-CHI-01]|uniref:tetratricopeptide repeat protein n=1 Tax=Coleofasciculus sp. D1-CHI-01 TaxID=3068482 RepID=UPI003302849C
MKPKVLFPLLVAFSLTTGIESIVWQRAIADTQNPKPICPENSPCRFPRRSGLTDIRVITPPRGSLLNPQPTLSWTPLADTQEYTVRLLRSGETIWELPNVRDTEIPYPANQSPLTPGINYELMVEADGKAGKSMFRLMTPSQAESVMAEVQEIRQKNLSVDEMALQLAEVYQDYDLMTAAIQTLTDAIDQNSQSLEVYQSLGNLYNRLELPRVAELVYQESLDLASSRQDIAGLAQAQIGLAKSFVAQEKLPQAVEALTAAYSHYQQLNNAELTPQVAQFLGEVYEMDNNYEEARRWYQDAKAGYEAIGAEQRIEYIEKVMRRLN